MPERIRLVALVANGFVCVAFAIMALASLGSGQPAMVVLFTLIAATAGFSWHVIRKAALVLSEEAWRRLELERQLAILQPGAAAQPPEPLQGPAP